MTSAIVLFAILALVLLSGWLIGSELNRDMNSKARNWPRSEDDS